MAPIIKPPPQEKQSLDPRDYQVRIIVAGSRGYSDRREFHDVVCKFIERFEGQDLLFISGAASSGADDFIIRWCKRYGYPCKEMPADWDNPEYKTSSGKSRAGFVRNADMARIGTHLLAFYDGQSPGTAGMIDEAIREKLTVKIVKVTLPDKDGVHIVATPVEPKSIAKMEWI